MKLSCEQVATLRGDKWDSFQSRARVYGIDGLCPTITANGGGYHEVKIMDNRARERAHYPRSNRQGICDSPGE